MRSDSIISPATEELLALGDAVSFLPNRPSPATLWRWRTRGVEGPTSPHG